MQIQSIQKGGSNMQITIPGVTPQPLIQKEFERQATFLYNNGLAQPEELARLFPLLELFTESTTVNEVPFLIIPQIRNISLQRLMRHVALDGKEGISHLEEERIGGPLGKIRCYMAVFVELKKFSLNCKPIVSRGLFRTLGMDGALVTEGIMCVVRNPEILRAYSLLMPGIIYRNGDVPCLSVEDGHPIVLMTGGYEEDPQVGSLSCTKRLLVDDNGNLVTLVILREGESLPDPVSLN